MDFLLQYFNIFLRLISVTGFVRFFLDATMTIGIAKEIDKSVALYETVNVTDMSNEGNIHADPQDANGKCKRCIKSSFVPIPLS